MSTGHALTIAIFVAVYIGMALGRFPGLAIDRTGIALLGALILYLAGLVDGAQALAAIDFETLVVLFGLMILSAQYAACNFYDWCSARIAAAAVSPAALLALTIATAGGLSAVLANDVVVFAMTPMLCRGLMARGLDPRPFVVALAAAANAGSAATAIGNPQNILIAQHGGLDFWQFLAVCGPPAVVALAIVYLVILLLARGQLRAGRAGQDSGPLPALDRAGLSKAVLATVALLGLFATPLPHVEGVLVVAGFLLISRRLATRSMLGLVDWHLLLLFAALFLVTDAFAATGLTTRALAFLEALGLTFDRLTLLLPLALAGSNSIGNVPLVVLLLQLAGPQPEGVLYTLAVTTTLAGNLLLTGSLANIIAVERAAGEGVQVGFREHARFGVPITLLSMAAAGLWLWAIGVVRL
jgi:Na+/H+ antiporter NhaD/arsenite permease-like protein